MNPPANRRRKTLWTMAILGAGVLAAALAAADWRLVRAEYHAFRLNRTETWEAAHPHLEALLDLAGHEPAARAVVEKLGDERQWLTFWVFRRIAWLEPSTASQAARVLPWLRQMVRRSESNPAVTAAWTHFVRWWGQGFVRIAYATALEETGEEAFKWLLDPRPQSSSPQPFVPLPGWEGPMPDPSYPRDNIPLSEFFDP